MPKIRKLPSGNYNVRVYRNGVSKSFTAPTKAQALYLASQWANSSEDDKTPTETINNAIWGYINAKKGVLSPASIREYTRIANKYFDEIKDIPINDFTIKDAQSFVSDLALTHSPKTTKDIYAFLKSALKMYAPEKRFDVTLPKPRQIKERTVPTDAQLKRLLDAADPQLRLAIILGSYSMRRSEVCALAYEDVNKDMRYIYVRHGMVQDVNKKWIIKAPKTPGSQRTIPVDKTVIDLIGDGKGLIFDFNPNKLTRDFERLRNQLQINVSFHSLRRYMASILHALGFPDKYIQERGGWKSPNVMRSCYENVLEDKNVELTKKQNEYYSDLLKKVE